MIYIYDSSGFGRYFTRRAGTNGLFFAEFGGLPVDPKTGYGPGEYADIQGNLFSRRDVENEQNLL